MKWLGTWFTFVAAASLAQAQTLDLKKGDHISIIGNTLADRMQHDGWLETYLHTRFPQHDLVFRNLGFSGDELTTRLRSQDFGSPDKWLSATKTDVVFAFFGYNESFADKAGLPKFKNDLDTFVKQTLAKKYNGNTAPRLVLFSPIAHENLRSPHLPDGSDNNERIALYTAAMQEVAAANKVPFVNLFEPSQKLYAKAGQPLTINGVHLNEDGNEMLAKAIEGALFPSTPAPQRTTEQMEKVRQAVRDRNFYWFNRYRTVDGYSIFGGRADLKFVEGQTNRVVAQREMEVLDVMTANRDQRIWAIAKGGDVKVDDSNTPPFIPVTTNKPGPLPGGKHVFLDGEAAIQKMTIAKGLKVNLFASEKEWPELANPVQMQFDTAGRLWVAAWPTYPHWKPKEPMNDRLLVFEDANGDGKADKMTVFADNLHCPTGFEFYNGGVLVAQAPDLVFLKDTDGDGKADVRQRVLSGLDSADTHHTSNSFALDPGGALYFQEGTFHHTQVETPYGPAVRNANAGVFRYEPRTQKFETYVNFGFANPHGHIFDRWGKDIVVDGTGANPYDAALFSGQVDYPQRHGRPPQVYKQKTRPCPGMEILSSRHWPEANQGNLLVPNVIGFCGILQYQLRDKGASFEGIEVEPLLSSSDPNFRPVDLKIGPDGALYFVDWQNPIIGHMQHNLRDPSRDREHGRIYRVACVDRPLLKPVKIAGEPIDKLLELLKEPEDRVRYRARVELGGRPSDQVLAALKTWIADLDERDPNHEHHLMEALWVRQYHDSVDEGLLKRMLRSPDARARAAATRVLCYWRDRVRDPLGLLRTQINDSAPRVRLEAVRALGFFHDEKALTVAVELLGHPDDEYLQFTFDETINTLERRLGSGSLNRKNFAGSILKMLDKTTDPSRQAGLIETVVRHGSADDLTAIWARAQKKDVYPPEVRRDVLTWLAEAAATRRVQPAFKGPELAALLSSSQDDSELLSDAIHLAAAWKAADMAPELEKVARAEKTAPSARQAAIAALAKLKGADGQKVLTELSETPFPVPTRLQAAVALSQLDLKAGAHSAARAIAAAGERDEIGFVVEAFLQRKQGPAQLAAALEGEKVSPDTAKQILRAMMLAGQNDANLARVAGKLAGLDAVIRHPTPADIHDLAVLAMEKGDPARGELIFRRADLGCLSCHAINKAGAHIGPDLGPIGSSVPPDYVVAAILEPGAAIKEEYITKTVTTVNDQILTGILVERNKNVLVLKDATGKLIRIPAADIDSEAPGKSLMPEGITRMLTKAELIDLVRFVAELGKPGPFGPLATPTLLRYKLLRNLPTALGTDLPNRDVVRDVLLRDDAAPWETVYALVNGRLPLDESAGKLPAVVYVQGEFQVNAPGPIDVQVDTKLPATFWIDEVPFEKQSTARVDLARGRHRITVRLEAASVAAAALRVEVRKPAESKALVEVQETLGRLRLSETSRRAETSR